MLLGILLGLSPLAARNLAVGAPLLGTASMGGVNFAIGNVYNPEHEQGQFEVQRIVGVLEKSRGKTAPAIIASIQTFPSGWAYVEHLGRKFAKAFNWYEEPDNANFYYFSLHSWLLRWLPGRMVTVAPLGLLGLVLAARNFRRAAPLYLLVATCLAVPVLFFVADRFRAPLAAALIPFAGLTLCRLVEWFAGKAFRKSVPALVAVALLAWWANSGEPTTLIRPIDYRMGATLYYLPEAERAMRQNDFGSSLRIMKENLALEPEGLTTDRLTSEQAQVAAVFGQLNAAVAAMLKARGLEQQAQHYEQHALSLQSAARRTMN